VYSCGSPDRFDICLHVAERAPGWYIDPDNARAHRYWNGRIWEPAWMRLSAPSAGIARLADPELLDYRSTAPGREPQCEVLVRDRDGQPIWCPGLVRGWYRYSHGWSASVQYSVQPGSDRLATFPVDQLRKVETPGDEAPR
jgi:hypothetical protein